MAAPARATLVAEGLDAGQVLLLVGSDDVCVHFDQLVRALDMSIRLEWQGGWVAQGWYRTREHFFRIAAGHVRTVAGDDHVQAGDVQQRPEGACVKASAFARWTGVMLRYDRDANKLTVESPWPLHMATRLRLQRRAQVEAQNPAGNVLAISAPYAWWRAPSLDVLSESQLRRAAPGAPIKSMTRYDVAAAGEAAHLSLRMRLTSDDHAMPQQFTARALRYDPDGGLFGPLRVRQFGFGDVDARLSRLVNQSGSGRGAYITNEDMHVLQGFSRTELRGALSPGWDAELYRNGELIDYATDDGSGYFLFANVPLTFGNNEFEIIRYGPQGQQTSERRHLHVGQGSLAQGQLHYWFGALRDQESIVDWVRHRNIRPFWSKAAGLRATALGEYGLSDSTALSLQWHQIDVRNKVRHFFESNLRYAGRSHSWEANMAYSHGTVWQFSYMGRVADGDVQLSRLQTFGDFVSDIVPEGLLQRTEGRWEKSLHFDEVYVPLTLGFDYARYYANARFSMRSQIGASWGNFSINQGWSAVAAGTGVPQASITTTRINWRRGAWRLRSELRYHLGQYFEIYSIATVADWSRDSHSNIRLELNREMNSLSQMKMRIDYTKRLRFLNIGGYGARDNKGGWQMGLRLSASFGPSAHGWGQMRGAAQTSQSFARVKICDDQNQNGTCDAEDAPLSDQPVRSQSSAIALSDAQGMALVENLVPWKSERLYHDRQLAPDSDYAPPARPVAIIGRPGVATPVDYAMVPVGKITGQLLGADMTLRIGVALLLLDDEGHKIASTQSDWQGAFLFNVPARRCYRLVLEAKEAARLAVSRNLREGLCLHAAGDNLYLGRVQLPTSSLSAPLP